MSITDETSERYARVWAGLNRAERDETWTLAIEGGQPSESLFHRIKELDPVLAVRAIVYWSGNHDDNATEVLVLSPEFREWLLERGDDPSFER